LSNTPARIIEPAVGASVCASGSQVWNGQMGTLMAKAITKAQKATAFTVPIGKVIGSPRSVRGPSNVAHRSVIVIRSNVPEATPII